MRLAHSDVRVTKGRQERPLVTNYTNKNGKGFTTQEKGEKRKG